MKNKTIGLLITIIFILAIVGGVGLFYITNTQNNTSNNPSITGTEPENGSPEEESSGNEEVTTGIFEKFENNFIHFKVDGNEAIQKMELNPDITYVKSVVETNTTEENGEKEIKQEDIGKKEFEKGDDIGIYFNESDNKKKINFIKKFVEKN
jgi:hypothetical protein